MSASVDIVEEVLNCARQQLASYRQGDPGPAIDDVGTTLQLFVLVLEHLDELPIPQRSDLLGDIAGKMSKVFRSC